MSNGDGDATWKVGNFKVVNPFAGFAGLFMASALWVPYVMAVLTTGLYLLFPSGETLHDRAIAVGVLATLLIWLLAASMFGSAALAPAAHAEAYDRIRTRLRELSAWAASTTRTDPTATKALASATEQLKDVEKTLTSHGRVDTRWVMSTGYIGVWRTLHQTEAEMFQFADDDFLVRESTRDALRLDGSEIPQRLAISGRLKAALTTVSPMAAANLDGGQAAAGATPYPAATVQGLGSRAVLSEIHRAVSEYRDDLRSGIVRHRNASAAATILFGFVTYALLALAISRGASPGALSAALAFFLSGAVIGLFGRLWSDTQNQSVEDDYGLSIVRLVQTPLFSGLAALVAIVVFPLLYANSVGDALKFGDADAGRVLENAFNLMSFPFGLVLALIFGLSPGLLLDRLHQSAEDYKQELMASRATTGK
jgi:hypothetical protein